MKLIKFDTLYPAEYLQYKIQQFLPEIKKMNFKQYHNWLIKLRMNYSDFYSYNLSKAGWEAEEFFLNDDVYLKKCGKYHFGILYSVYKLLHRFHNMVSHTSVPFSERIVSKHLKYKKPDVLLIREQVFIRSSFWETFKNRMLVVSRMDCGLSKNWSPLSFDLIYSNIPSFIDFFKANNVPVKQNNNGFDERILKEIQSDEKIYDVSFVGGLGSYYGFINKTETFEKLLALKGDNFNFSWWGYKTGNFDDEYPLLAKHYKGSTGGIDMFNIYSQSKIVVNDYGAGVGGVGVNQRIHEVLGIGTLLITRESITIKDWHNYLETYEDVNDCAEKIQYYLNHESEREKIAKNGQEFVLKNFNYAKLMIGLGDELNEAYQDKINNKKV